MRAKFMGNGTAKRKKVVYLLLLIPGILWGAAKAPPVAWRKVDTGLYLASVDSPVKSALGDSKITILKINPKYYHFKLVSAKETNEPNKTAKEWAKSRNLAAVINAGMYQEDYKTNAGFMKNYDFFNNRGMNKYNAVTAFNRKTTDVPEFQVIDLKCQDWNTLKKKYHSFVQGIRMIDCRQKNRWRQQDKKWSIAVIGRDKRGNALFIFSRSPYSAHDFVDILLRLPLSIYNAMYLEGGHEASFYLNHNGMEIQKFGSYETGFHWNDNNNPWPLPNVIGITKK